MTHLPPLPSGIVVNHFIVSDDAERSARFYADVLGGRVVFSPVPTAVELSNTFIVINAGGGRPTTSPRSRS
jgi:catechol 2,3-dioxygenase-like lactoylglutathione lyase family enzyme